MSSRIKTDPLTLKYILIATLTILSEWAVSQKKVAITIDDVPNSTLFMRDNYQSVLLEKLDSLHVPISIFINENLIYKTDALAENFSLLNDWAKKDYITLGNHSMNHARYSKTDFDSFTDEIMTGEAITRQLARKYDKPLKYFRFPYNDLGQDAVQHRQIKHFLAEKNYIIAPFTIESADWMYNAVYKHYLQNNDFTQAKAIGNLYLTKTLEAFDFFEGLSKDTYKRDINHIYLCHDNRLNADMLPQLILELKNRGYEIISLEEALTDTVYQQKDLYEEKWGISWMYRWMETQDERYRYMKEEPSTEKITRHYNKILKKNTSNQ
ncbi:MAG: polysaccharide deacetylase family protein [Cyclobacteriaceae bacterium]